MENKGLEKLLRGSAIPRAVLPQGKEALKNALMNLNRPYRRWQKVKLWSISGILLGCFCIAAAFFLVVEDNDQPGPTNNLGGIWSTFTDSAQGGNSTVWPPTSTSCQNLFVKSAPGYGGKGYAVRIKGTTGIAEGAFLGVNTYLSQNASCPHCMGIDLRMYKGIRFKMKGTIERGKLFFVLPHESRTPTPDRSSCMTLTGYNDYQADITDLVKDNWTDVKLVFGKDFSRPVPSSQKLNIETVLEDENLIKWKWNGEKNQKIDLWIDDVEFGLEVVMNKCMLKEHRGLQD
jgi:hypothetical protein